MGPVEHSEPLPPRYADPMAWRIEIDRDECVSGGKCIHAAPEVFAFDDEELAFVLPDAPELTDAALLRIARDCPGRAISLWDGDTAIEF